MGTWTYLCLLVAFLLNWFTIETSANDLIDDCYRNPELCQEVGILFGKWQYLHVLQSTSLSWLKDNLQHDRNNFEPNALLEIQFYISSRLTKPQETLTIGHFWPNNWNQNIFFLFHLYQSEVVWVHGYFFKSSAY